MLVTLRLGFSHLCEHKFRHNFLDTLNPLFLAATSLKQLHTIFCAVTTFFLLVQFIWTLVSVNSMKLLYQIYFYEEVIQRKVHHRIATFSRALSNIYLQQDGLMNHSFIGHTYIHDLYYILFYIIRFLTTCSMRCTNEIYYPETELL